MMPSNEAGFYQLTALLLTTGPYKAFSGEKNVSQYGNSSHLILIIKRHLNQLSDSFLSNIDSKTLNQETCTCLIIRGAHTLPGSL